MLPELASERNTREVVALRFSGAERAQVAAAAAKLELKRRAAAG
jgi:hypothetical protein